MFFWPIKGIDLPSLWTAVAGDRPVPDKHDDPGHVTWGWKDDALPKRIWYYAKVLRRKATMISLETAPYFYALSENYGSFEEDHLVAYEQGHLTLAARNVYEALLTSGPLDSISLRKAGRMAGPRSPPGTAPSRTFRWTSRSCRSGLQKPAPGSTPSSMKLSHDTFPSSPSKPVAIGESGCP